MFGAARCRIVTEAALRLRPVFEGRHRLDVLQDAAWQIVANYENAAVLGDSTLDHGRIAGNDDDPRGGGDRQITSIRSPIA
ncbi:hypothetical protein TSO5_03450 [Azospirillum sp. TSO5]|nr:hypothetical protein TSO5_03450 [Azospirillum sp. TSO5]